MELWVEPVGTFIIARVRGTPTEALLEECQKRVLDLARETGKHCVLYDMLEMDAPAAAVAWSQRKLDEKSGDHGLRRAIVVSSTKIAYLARVAFGDGDYHVFYSDMTAAVTWLNKEPSC